MTQDTQAPERLWLQDGGEWSDEAYLAGEITWCDSEVDSNDTEYVRADLLTAAEAELHTLKTAGICEVAARNPSVMEYMRHREARAEAAEAERDRLAEKLAVYEAKEAAYSARLQEHFRVKQQCDRCGHQSIDWLGENAACPRHSCSGGMVALATMEKTNDHTD